MEKWGQLGSSTGYVLKARPQEGVIHVLWTANIPDDPDTRFQPEFQCFLEPDQALALAQHLIDIVDSLD